jgi:hypothetical protein
MNQHNKSKKWTLAIIIVMTLILAITITYAAFTVNPQINPTTSGELFTYQDLECRWTIDMNAPVNVTWYKSGVLNTTYNTSCTTGDECRTQGSGIISQSLTTKGDIWTCEIQYFNGTDIESKNVSRLIADAAPTTPRVFLNETEILNNSVVNIGEDNVTIFKVNSTDADNDPVTYPPIGQIPAFCSLNSVNGDFTCSPTQESDIGLHNATVFAQSGETEIKLSGFKFIINVTPSNDAPYFNPTLSSRQVNEGAALNYIIYGADPENNVPFNFSVQSDLSSLIVVSLSNTSASIRFNHSGQDTAQFSDRGNHTINVTIIDSGIPSKGYQSSFTLEVIPTNHKPNITVDVINASSLTQGGQLLIRINATDLDNDTITFTTNNPQLYNITYSSTDKSNPDGTSFANGTIYVALMTNDYVINRNLIITAFDGKESSNNTTFLNITNINDNPVLNEISNHASNTLSNTNMSNLTAYTGVLFRYVINSTDIDQLTYAGDTLTYASNDSNFPVNMTTGMINFTKTQTGTYYVKINVTDAGGLYDERVALINIYDNQDPYFTSAIQLDCAEYDSYNYPNNCTIDIGQYSNDSDIGDSVVLYWTNNTLFNINSTSGVITFRANQSIIGNYSVMVNITDTRGGMNSTIMQAVINNTNNRPSIIDITEPSGRLIIQQGSYNYGILANDSDLYIANTYENLTFNYSVAGPNSSIVSIVKIPPEQAVLTVTPTSSQHAGSYVVTVTVTDYYGNTTTDDINFFIYNITSPPNITQVMPYGTPLSSGPINTSWVNVSNLGRSNTTITISENTSYVFNHSTSYDMSYTNSLSYEWYYDGISAGTSYALNESFNFFSAGMHNITLIATDDFDKNSTFMWIINVTNVNRPAVLINQLTNLTGVNAVNGTTTFSNYMTYYSSQAKFYDPDDDVNEDNIVDDTESTMTFNVTSCPYASFTFINNSLKVQSLNIGTCSVNFTAHDSANSSITANSSEIFVNVTYVSNETITEEVPTTTSGGGGGGTRTVTIPIPEEVEKPKPLEIITPKLVTIYKNATVTIPIIINNTWNDTLEGVTITADTNATNVSIYLDKTYFPRLFKDQNEEATLTISNYKSEGHYEIQVRAKVIDPEFTDTATIYVNSADTKSEGEDLETMISFARDLLSSNPECQELTELLNEAKKELAMNNYEGTAKLVDNVINGCKYLVSSSSQVEKPSQQVFKRFVWKSIYTQYAIIGTFALLFIVALYYIIKKDKQDV